MRNGTKRTTMAHARRLYASGPHASSFRQWARREFKAEPAAALSPKLARIVHGAP